MNLGGRSQDLNGPGSNWGACWSATASDMGQREHGNPVIAGCNFELRSSNENDDGM